MSSFFFITPLNYLLFLAACLLLYLGYLLLPRGLRADHFGEGTRRRHRRRRGTSDVGVSRDRGRVALAAGGGGGGGWTQSSSSAPAMDIMEGIYANSNNAIGHDSTIAPAWRDNRHMDLFLGGTTTHTPSSQTTVTTITTKGHDAHDAGWGSSPPAASPSISHSTLSRAIGNMLHHPPGLKFVAHGTRCPPRPVWITLHRDDGSASRAHHPQPPPSEYRNRLTWRAELKRHRDGTAAAAAAVTGGSPSPLSPSSIPEGKLGNLRTVELHDVLGIELGKLTTALRRVQTAGSSRDVHCFSLLTRNGTLDLECVDLRESTTMMTPSSSSSSRATPSASAEEVRAAFVACLARVMSSSGGLRLDDGSSSTWEYASSTPYSPRDGRQR